MAKYEIEIEITPVDMANLFWNLDASEQAEFFNQLGRIKTAFNGAFDYQIDGIFSSGKCVEGMTVIETIIGCYNEHK